MKRKKITAASLAVLAAMTVSTMPVMAEDEEKIGSVRLDFDIEMPEPEGEIPDVLDVETDTEGVEITDAYFTKNDDEWERGDRPTIKVELEAKDGWYFSSPKISKVDGLRDVDSKSIKRGSDKQEATVTIKLEEVGGELDAPEDLDWNDTEAQWEEVDDAEYYSVRLYRDDKKVATISTDDTEFDFYHWMTRAGDYTFEVRAEGEDSNDDSEWSDESDYLEISSSETYEGSVPSQTNFRDGKTESGKHYNSGDPGMSGSSPSSSNGWKQDQIGWMFYQNGNRVTYSWVRDGAYWYYIGPDSYMKTGWQQVNGAWYYMNPEAGGPQGSMRIGWLNLNNVWYYLDPSGAMATGYRDIGGYSYYFTDSGALLMNGAAPDGRMAGVDGILR